jgi:peptide/nickel transport system permease protein
MIGQSSNKATEEAIAKEFHLDQPPMVRLLISLNEISPLSYFSEAENAVFAWDSTSYEGIKLFSIAQNGLYLKYPYFGKSFQNQERVTTLLAQRFLSTLVLALCSIVFATIIGVLLGILAAVKKNTWIDQACLAFSAMGISAPSFFVAILIALLFGYYLSEWTGLSFKGSLIEMDDYGNRIYVWKNLILPVIALGLRPVAILTQITRNSMLDVLGEDYIRTAKAKGLSPRVVFFKHALLNALNPVITSVSGWFGSLLAGAYFIEVIFDFKGLGNLTVNALMKFDIPVVMGASLYVAFTFVVISFVVDFLYLMIDPRMRK